MTRWNAPATEGALSPAEAEEILLRVARGSFPELSCADSVESGELPHSLGAYKLDEEHRYRTLLEQLPAIVFLGSLLEGTSRAYISPQIGTILGYSPSEWLENPLRWYAAIHPDDKSRVSVDAARLFITCEPVHSIYKVIAKDGRVVWLRCEAKLMREEHGRPSYIQGMAFDVTELMKAQSKLQAAKEAAEAANRAKSDFLVNVSHEIRTPMNGVMAMTELALETELTEEQREYLKTAKYSADILMLLINDILDFSKLEFRRMELEHSDFACHRVVDHVLDSLGGVAQQKGLSLVLQISPDVPEIVRGDGDRLRQILLHMIGNAIKFTERGEVRVSVAVEAELPDAVVLHFQVADTGIGIPPDVQQTIFEPFTQVDSSPSRKYGGAGLGLTICARLVEMMYGRIWVESEAGHGSTFHFTARFGCATAAMRCQSAGSAEVQTKEQPVPV
jgi:protein-histidine pros-kinase